MSSLLDRRVVFVTGKGGVGRTTVCAALALHAREQGVRTVVCEVGEQHRLPALFGRPPALGREVELEPGLAATTLDPQTAMREYLASQVPRPLVRLLADSRSFQYLYAAAPSAREMAAMGAIWDLVHARLPRRQADGTFDLVIVDAPATGHAMALLSSPRTIGEIARVGPMRRHADRIRSFFADPDSTALVAVAAPAELPVNETLDLEGRLRHELGRGLDLIVANGVYRRRFDPADVERLAALDGRPGARAAVASAASHAARVRAQQAQMRRLRRPPRVGVATLPYLFEPELDLAAVERLAVELGRRLRDLDGRGSRS